MRFTIRHFVAGTFLLILTVPLFAHHAQPQFFGEKLPDFGPKVGDRLPYVLPVDQLPKSAYGKLSVSSTLE